MTGEQIYQLHCELMGLAKPERRKKRIAFAGLHKVTLSAVDKRLRTLRAKRKGARKPRIGQELRKALEIIWTYKITPDGQIPTRSAQQLAFSEGKIPRLFAISSLNETARKMGLNPSAPYVQRMEAEFANQAHRVDASGSRHFQVVERAEDGDWILKVVRKEQRNKRWEGGEMLWMVSVIDDYSRAMSVRYVVAPGESAAIVQDALVEIWRTGPPLGMPEEFLICDQGSFGKEQSTRALMGFYDIELILGQPGNSQRNGRVERPFRPIKEDFERSHLATHEIGARVRLSQLREELSVFVTATNEGRHPIRRDRTKLQDWERSISFRSVRECPEDVLRLATYREVRTISNEGWVQHGNNLFEIIGLPHGLRGRKITLVYNRERELVAEHDGGTYEVRPAEAVALGTFAGKKEPPAKRVEKAAAERERTGVGAYSKKRRDALDKLGSELTAPGQPVLNAPTGADTPRVITPPPRLRAVEPVSNPFKRATTYPTLEAARERISNILTFPLHAALSPEHRAGVDALLEKNGLDRKFTDELAYQLKQTIRI